jgi:hypothetical protein
MERYITQNKEFTSEIPFGAGEGIRDRLLKLFNDSSEETKLLAFQLKLLKNHTAGRLSTF